jgi:hypothetical protein
MLALPHVLYVTCSTLYRLKDITGCFESFAIGGGGEACFLHVEMILYCVSIVFVDLIKSYYCLHALVLLLLESMAFLFV